MVKKRAIINKLENAICVAVILLAVTASAVSQENGNEKAYKIPKVVQVNEMTVKKLLKPEDKPLLVNFWATWCVPCREEFPDLVEIDKEYENEIDFITISLDDLAEINRDVPKFLREMKATMPTYLLYTNDENGVIGAISKDWAGGLPFTVLYDKGGKIIHTKQGKIRADFVRRKISQLIEPAKK